MGSNRITVQNKADLLQLYGFREPLAAVNHLICFSCYVKPSTSSLSKCGACRRVSYCSKACKTLIESNQSKVPVAAEGRTWEMYKEEKEQEMIRLQIDRGDNSMCRLIDFEPICCSCFRSGHQLGPNEKLITCSDCHSAYFCSSCPQQHVASDCHALQRHELDERFTIDEAMKRRSPYCLVFSTKPMSIYTPLSEVKGFYEFYSEVAGLTGLKKMVKPNWDLLSKDNAAIHTAGHLISFSPILSSVLTVIAALEATIPNLQSKDSLILHFIGSRLLEMQVLEFSQTFLHLLPALKTLALVFVGPDIDPPMLAQVGPGKPVKYTHRCVSACTQKKQIVTYSLWPTTYEQFAILPAWSRPDLAIAYHAGLTDPDLWQLWHPAIALLTTAPYPTVITCYSRLEMQLEAEILSIFSANLLQAGEINKWRSLRSKIFTIAGDSYEERIAFDNHYWYIIGPQKLVLEMPALSNFSSQV